MCEEESGRVLMMCIIGGLFLRGFFSALNQFSNREGDALLMHANWLRIIAFSAFILGIGLLHM